MSAANPVAQPLSESESRTWAMLAHLSGLVIPVIGPLVIMLVFGPRSAFTRAQAVEALNFQIMWLVAWIISWVTVAIVIGIVLLPVVWVVGIVFFIIGGIKANAGEDYRYPFNVRLVK